MTDPSSDQTNKAFVGAFGLLRTYVDERPRYVARRTGNHLDLIRAIRLDGETYKSSLEVAIADQLGLRLRKDYIVSGVPRAHLNSRICGSLCGSTSDEPRWYVCEFYIVSLYGKQWQAALEASDDVVWLTPRDIVRGHGPDGTALKPDVFELLKIAEAIPPDEAS